MRLPVFLVFAVLSAVAQTPSVRLNNATRPSGGDFLAGDRFEIVIAGAPNQPVSVRTARQGRTDWSPVIGFTDAAGRWSAAGQFAKGDFGGWSEVWTVGGKLADPVVQFYVGAPCLKEAQGFAPISGPNMALTCETAAGRDTFSTPSLDAPFRTPELGSK